MKFHGLMVIRDEEDILPQSLAHLLSWLDGLYILDLGSTDSTWEIVEAFARKDSRIVPFGKKPIIYTESLRCILFQEYRDRFRNGDWICKVDADEFYEITPPRFVREHLRAGETAVSLGWYYFRLTSTEVGDYERGLIDLFQDRKRPIEERRRFYKIPEYSEPRMFRYRDTMQWPETVAFPFNAGYMAREVIPIRHYPHRDPLQMSRRYNLRSLMMKVSHNGVGPPQWKLADWRQDVIDIDSAGNARERNEGLVGLGAAHNHTSGELREWVSGEPLPKISFKGHMSFAPKRAVQRVIHPALLPVLDRLRKPMRADYAFPEVPDEITRQLCESC
ncbi:MAG TPA: glycosyltransferase family 2 protein [Blastocatellia bacterium]